MTSSACLECSRHRGRVGIERGDLGKARGTLARAQMPDHPNAPRIDKLQAEVLRLEQRLADTELALEVHQANPDCTANSTHPDTRRRRNLTRDEIAQIRRRVLDGQTQAKIAEELGCSRSTIATYAAAVHRDTPPIAAAPLIGGIVGENWLDQALCAQTDPESFYPDKGGSTREAKRTCLRCEVRDECLQWALANCERYGIWGGLSERERRKLQRPAAATPSQPAEQEAS